MATESIVKVKKQANQLAMIGTTVALFFFSFLFFLYFTFPYGVLKEAVRSKIAVATGIDMKIKSLGPKFFLGLSAHDVEIGDGQPNTTLKLNQIDINVGVLSVLLGKLAIDLGVEEALGGYLRLGVGLSLFGILGGSEVVPKSISLKAKGFNLDGIARFALEKLSSDPATNPLVAPLLKKVGVAGKLDGDADFRINASDISKSTGSGDIKILQAALKLNDPSLNLPDQNFSKAQIKVSVDNGNMSFDPISGFTAPELDVSLKGKVTLKPTIGASGFDVNVGIKLDKELKEQYGFLMDAATGQQRNGELTLQVRGPVSAPTIEKF